MQDEYQFIARYYDLCTSFALRPVRLAVAEMVHDRRAGNVLDVCCGTGRQLVSLAASTQRVCGIDISSAMLGEARQNVRGRGQLVRADAARIPFADEMFEAVVISFALHEKPQDVRLVMLAEAARVLKQDGILVVADYVTSRGRRAWWSAFGASIVERIAGGEHYRLYKDFMARGALDGLLAGAGCSIFRSRLLAEGAIGIYAARRSDISAIRDDS